MSDSIFTRRELLAAFLGAPFALAACHTRGRETPLPEGVIVGASDRVGHALRDGLRPEPEAWESAGVVIVGGGVAGLAAAWRFLRAGFEDFVLLELEEAPGGTARSGSEHGVVPYPWGAHYLPAPLKENRALVTLLEELGVLEGADAEGQPVVAEQFLCRDPEERVFYRGRWYEGLYLHAGASEEDARQLRLFNAEVDAWAGLFYFASRMKRPGAEAQSLITWPEGNGRLVRHLYEKARAHVRLGLAAADVRPASFEDEGRAV